MYDPLGKNLLLPCWGFFFFFGVLDLVGVLWRRIFCFLTRDCLNMFGSIGEESTASFMGMMYDRLELSRKNLLLPLGG